MLSLDGFVSPRALTYTETLLRKMQTTPKNWKVKRVASAIIQSFLYPLVELLDKNFKTKQQTLFQRTILYQNPRKFFSNLVFGFGVGAAGVTALNITKTSATLAYNILETPVYAVFNFAGDNLPGGRIITGIGGGVVLGYAGIKTAQKIRQWAENLKQKMPIDNFAKKVGLGLGVTYSIFSQFVFSNKNSYIFEGAAIGSALFLSVDWKKEPTSTT